MRKTVMSDLALGAEAAGLAAVMSGGGIDIVDATGNRLVTVKFSGVSNAAGQITAKCDGAFPVRNGDAAGFVVRPSDPRAELWRGTVGKSGGRETFDMTVRTTEIREGVLFEVEEFIHQLPATATD